MFYVVILFFLFGSREPESGEPLSLQPASGVWEPIVFGIQSLGGHRLWQPEAGIREALIYFLEYHCTTSWEIKLQPSLVGREITSIR